MANRYFVRDLPAPGRTTLDGELAHHLARVLRVRPGEEVALGDGAGNTARATVVAAEPRGVVVDVGRIEHVPPLPLQVTLAFAVPRSTRAEWLLEHATEVGVATFQPLWTARTRPQGERGERWLRIVRAAAGQCDRAWLPQILPAQELPAWLAGPLPAGRLLAAAAGSESPTAIAAGGDVALLVGPEGGFDASESAAIAAAGFVPVRLGPHVLRTETAALLGAGLLLATVR